MNNQTDPKEKEKKYFLLRLRDGFVVRVPEEEIVSTLAADRENAK